MHIMYLILHILYLYMSIYHVYFNLDSPGCMNMYVGRGKSLGTACREMTNAMIYDGPHMILLL